MKKNKNIISRNEDFAKWYTSIIQEAKLIQYYDVKGFMIYQPYGWEIWERIKEILDKKLKETGSQNLCMPTLIPLSEFQKEKDHIEGFNPELFTITEIGNNKLSEKLAIRPTSEIAFCKYWQNSLSSYKDLPLKHNQWCNVFRAEKTTKPFLRNSEFHWQELHCVFETKEEAENYTLQILDIYSNLIANDLCIPNIKGIKTEGEKFAGAEKTYTIETIMQDNQALQSATSHFFGNNFTKTYDVTYQTKNNDFKNPFSTSHGLSTRIIGAIIMVHSDDNGLILPWKIAPIQICIVPLFISKNTNTIKKAKELYDILKNQYRVKIDDTDKGIGFMIAEQEIKGIPLTIILGPNDLENNNVTLYRRDTSEKEVISLNKLEEYINDFKNNYSNNLYNKAKKYLDNAIVDVNSLEELKDVIKNNKWARCYFDGSIEQEKEIKEQTGASTRCYSITPKNGTCIINKKETNKLTIFARAY